MVLRNFYKIILLVTLLPFYAHANADENLGSEERVDHYEAHQPKNKAEALSSLKDRTATVGQILKSEALTDSDLERVHEVSYDLEAAVDYLRTHQGDAQEEVLDSLDEAVQAIHYASENHEEEKTREWFLALEKSTDEVNNVFK